MKKIFAVMLAAMLMLSAVGCNEAQSASGGPAAGEPKVLEPQVESNTMGANIWDLFQTKMKENPDMTPEAVANALVADAEVIPSTYMAGAMAVEPGTLLGFENYEVTGFEEGAVFMPMISVIPFIGYVFALPEDADVNAFISGLKDNCNLRWTISTQAEQVVAGAYGNTVLFVMCPESPDGSYGE